jgi:hypothetical protein
MNSYTFKPPCHRAPLLAAKGTYLPGAPTPSVRMTKTTIPGVGQLTALAFVAAIHDPSRIRRSRDIGAYLGLVPRRYQSGEVDYVGSISKCGDRKMRTLLYEAANVVLTRYKGKLELKDWAFAIAKRSTMRKARVALARRLAIIMHAMLRDGTEFERAQATTVDEIGGRTSSERSDARGRERMMAPIV